MRSGQIAIGVVVAALAGGPLIQLASAQQAATAPAGPSASPGRPAGDAKERPKASRKAAGEEKKREPGEGQRLLESGIAALQAGRHEQAIGQLSAALKAGGLPTAELARAMYFRGAAYRKQGKPALALADLTSALYLKNGLKDAERRDALEQRAAAYREAGLPDQTTTGVTTPVSTAAIASTPGVARAAAPAASGQPSAAPSQARSGQPPAAAPSAAGAGAGAPTAAAQPTSGGGIGGFFNSLFSGGSSASAPASTAPPAPPQSQTSAWSTVAAPTTPPGSAGRAARTASAGATSAPAAAAPAATPSGRFRLQIGNAKTRPEAEAMAQRVRQQNAGDLQGRQVEITEARFGTQPYYRVTIAPFADGSEPSELCRRLRTQGFDCLTVTQ